MDLCFANEQNYASIQQLYPVYQFQVNVGSSHHQNQQSFNLSLEKLDNIIQVRISDVLNQNKMFLCTIGKINILPSMLNKLFFFILDNIIYQELKTEQSLQVNFQGFIDHLITILDSCRNNEL